MIWKNRSSADGGRAVFSRPGKAGGWPTGQGGLADRPGGGGEAARFAGDVGTGGGTPRRRALRGVREVSSTTLGRSSPPKPLGGQADGWGPRGDGGAARRIVVPYGGKSRKGCPFLVSGACAGKNRNHFSPRRVRGEKYFSGRKCGKWPPQWGGHFMRAVGLRFHSPKAALLPWARKSLAEMFLGTFQRFKISMNSSPVMVSFS